MSNARGSSSSLRWKPEVTLGVLPAGNWNELTFTSETLGGTINPITSDEIRQDGTVPAIRGGNISNQGNIVTDFSPTRFGAFLAHLLGAAPTTTTITVPAVANTTPYVRGDVVSSGANDYIVTEGGTTGAAAAGDLTATDESVQTSGTAQFRFMGLTSAPKYRHVIRGSANYLNHGIAVEKAVLGGDEDEIIDFKGGRIDSMAVTMPQEGILKSTWNWMFLLEPFDGSVSQAGTPIGVAEDPFTGADCEVEIDGDAQLDMREANFTINNNAEGDTFRLGSRFRKSAERRRREATGSLTAYFENREKYLFFRNEQKVALLFTMLRGKDFMSIEYPETKLFGDATPKIAGPGNVMGTYTFNAFRQASAYDVEIVLKNQIATYST